MTAPPTTDDVLAASRALWRRNWPAGIPREPSYPFGEIPLGDYLRRWAALQPDKAAVIFYGTVLTYAEMDRLSDRFAALLARLGVGAGDRVALFLPNCPQFHVAFFGILKCGAVHVPVNPMFKEAELAYELNDTGAAVLVAQDQLMDLVRAARPGVPALRHVLVTSLAEMLPASPSLPVPPAAAQPRLACPDAADLMPALEAETGAPPTVRPDLDAPAALNYTGGTTGLPKGCVHTQRDMLYTAATTCAVTGPATQDDVFLNFHPIFWIAGENFGLLFPVFLGAVVVQFARWDPLAFMQAVQLYRVTAATLLVDNAVAIMDQPEVGRHDLRSLRRTRVSSFVKKLNAEYRRRWLALTGTVMVEAAWGMTETHTCDTFTTGMQEGGRDLAQPIFVGLPVPGTEFRICGFDTGATLPLGQEGEIVVRSPSQLKAYWNRPADTAAALRDGWLHTGDIGMLDGDGCLHFLGRRKEMLKVNGMSVFPAEIEALLGQHPGVTGSGVIGRADEARGERPVAFVTVSDPALTADALQAWCRGAMAGYKVPEIRIVAALPMTATGKVRKEELALLA